jgi:hypothetical protein
MLHTAQGTHSLARWPSAIDLRLNACVHTHKGVPVPRCVCLPFTLEFQGVNYVRPLLADVPQVETVVGCGRHQGSFIDEKLELDDGRTRS